MCNLLVRAASNANANYTSRGARFVREYSEEITSDALAAAGYL